MRKRLALAGLVAVAALALAAPSQAAFADPVLEQATLVVTDPGQRPAWKVRYLLCYTGSSLVQAQVSEFQFMQGAKFRTLQVQTRGQTNLQDPSERGAGGSCSWYQTKTYRSTFAQRAGYVNGVTLRLYEADAPERIIIRTFRLHP